MPHRTKIGVHLADARARPDRLLESLGALLPVEFSPLPNLSAPDCDAALLLGVSREQAQATAATGLRCLAFLGGESIPVLGPANVRLADLPAVPKFFRGRTLSDKSITKLHRLRPESGDEVLAQSGDAPLWIQRTTNGIALDMLATELPGLAAGDFLFQHFHRDNWAGLLPLLHFIREVSRSVGWSPPPLRACLMFDDPNLHWKSYGYVRYPQLIENAREHNYHVSFATVPLDGWYVNRATAALFQKHADRLSLLVHGNNHTQKELAQNYSNSFRQTLAVQSLARIARLEKAGGVEVSRVMAAPHGACSDAMAGVLMRAGFEAACISRGSIMGHNQDKAWPAGVGLEVSEFMGQGLPIIPRFRVTQEWPHEVLLAAFLGQPIIPVGHHEDLADGLGLLEAVAGVINSLGEVQWLDMKSIARSNFCTRTEGPMLRIKNYSRHLQLRVPESVEQICLERPAFSGIVSEGMRWQEEGKPVQSLNDYHGEPLAAAPGAKLEIVFPAETFNSTQIPPPRTPLWTVLRRQLCEGRDRLRPLVDSVRRKHSKFAQST